MNKRRVLIGTICIFAFLVLLLPASTEAGTVVKIEITYAKRADRTRFCLPPGTDVILRKIFRSGTKFQSQSSFTYKTQTQKCEGEIIDLGIVPRWPPSTIEIMHPGFMYMFDFNVDVCYSTYDGYCWRLAGEDVSCMEVCQDYYDLVGPPDNCTQYVPAAEIEKIMKKVLLSPDNLSPRCGSPKSYCPAGWVEHEGVYSCYTCEEEGGPVALWPGGGDYCNYKGKMIQLCACGAGFRLSGF